MQLPLKKLTKICNSKLENPRCPIAMIYWMKSEGKKYIKGRWFGKETQVCVSRLPVQTNPIMSVFVCSSLY